MSRRLVVADAVRGVDGILGDALLVDGTRVAAIGRTESLRSTDLPEERFPGATIVPGLRDAHLHPVGHAAALRRLTLKTAADFDEIADALRHADRRQPPGTAIAALRLDDQTLAEGRLPDRHFLDRAVPDRPVVLVRYCGHVAVANSAALDLAGIENGTVDPPGGSMDRDELGRLTGVLRETAADRVLAAVQAVAPPVDADALVEAVTALASVGITGVGAMAATDAGCWAGAGSEVDAVVAVARRLPMGMGVMVIASTPADLEAAAARLDVAGGRVRFLGVKMFSDGSLGGHTAAMHRGFADAPDRRGTDRLDPAWAEEMARAALRLGGLVAVGRVLCHGPHRDGFGGLRDRRIPVPERDRLLLHVHVGDPDRRVALVEYSAAQLAHMPHAVRVLFAVHREHPFELRRPRRKFHQLHAAPVNRA